ncbi:hypothetical protein SEA_BBQVALINDRA_63 [Gordonia phage BBQValindra]|nr:hypothetical protein SEA_BBQVALINDRA_63 [Gordonia phage BBQValindra]
MTAPGGPDDRDRVAGALPEKFVPTTTCRHCGHPIAEMSTPWGPKWAHLFPGSHERYCRLRTAEPEEDRLADH